MDGIEHNDALRNNRGDVLNNTWTNLLKELGCYEGLEDHVNLMRQRWVLGAAEWMSGSNGSKQNQKEDLGYSDSEWEFIGSTLIENGAWAVPPVRDAFGNWKKENCAPEMLIQFIAHDLGCHIIVFDLLLNRIQFCSGNHVLNDNVKFDSPIVLYSTGSHFQAVFQKDHDHFIVLARELENQQGSDSKPVSNIEGSTSTSSKPVQSHDCSGPDPQSADKLEPGSISKGSTPVSSQNFPNHNILDSPMLEPGTVPKIPTSLSSLGIKNSMSENIHQPSNKSGSTDKFKQYGGSAINSAPITTTNPTNICNRFDCLSNDKDDSQQNVDNNFESQECILSLEQIMKIPSKARTKEEKARYSKLYKHQMYLKRKLITNKMNEDNMKRKQKKEKHTDEERNNANLNDKNRMQQNREKQSKEEKDKVKLKDNKRKQQVKDNQSEEEKDKANLKNKKRMQQGRENQSQEEIIDSNKKSKKIMQKARENQTTEERNESNLKDKNRKEEAKKTKTEEEIQKYNRKQKETMREYRKKHSELARMKKFKERIRYGPIFVCSSCNQKMFQNGVCELDNKLQDKLKEKNLDAYQKVFENDLIQIPIILDCVLKKHKEEEPKAYICFTCKKHLKQGKIPPMSTANGLGLINLENDPDLSLSELENNLIAKRILFQKIYQLPRSRMAGCKDKLINIPIYDHDVINTVENLPRTPNEAGLLEVKLKRKIEYTNYHKKQYVSAKKIYKALNCLKVNNHPSYLFFDEIESYEERCQKIDPKGYDLVFVFEDGIDKIVDIDEYLENLKTSAKIKIITDIDEDFEYDDKKRDPTRKFQFNYDKSVCMVDQFPEAAVTENSEASQCLAFAPGEGKVPENILMSDNWDIDAFPMKYPDGKNGLHQKRERKLTDQYHFIQRLRNVDPRFCTDPSYVFASSAYLEKKQLQRNINVSFQRGKISVSDTGQKSYSLEDGFSVFDKISNTPAYWKTAKYEMLAKLENLGPFQFFFTLSCADSRWEENFSSLLADMGVSIIYKCCSDGNEETNVKTEKGTFPMKQYLEEYVDESRHEMIRTHVLNATRNYNHRVKAFIKEIILDKNNLMAVEYYSTKVEFQGRGAGHNHGTLWVNLKKMEYYIIDENGKWCDFDDLLDGLLEASKYSSELKNELKVLIQEIVQAKIHVENENVSEIRESALLLLRNLLKIEDVCPEAILSKFPLFGISTAFLKFQTNEKLLEHEENAIINFANKFTTCTLNQATIESMTDDPNLKKRGAEVLDIVMSVNIHNHTRTCKKYLTFCRFGFAKFPIWKTLVAKPTKLLTAEKKEQFTKILKDVRAVLDDEKIIEKVLSEYPNKKSEDREEYQRKREERIKKILYHAGLKTETDYELYISALEASTSGYSILLERDIDEMMVNSYNPEWARAWNGNHDLQICLDYFAVITYITEYYTKDDSGVITVLIDALKNADCEDLKDKMKLLMNTYISARQMGEAEALYKIFPDFHLKDSNVTTVFVPVSRKENRSKFLVKVDEEMNYKDQEKVIIDGREGVYVEKYDIVSKYERKEDGQEDISFSHFTKMYGPSWTYKENEKVDDAQSDIDSGLENDDEFEKNTKWDFIMRCRNDPTDPEHKLCHQIRGKSLKKYIKLKDPFPGEPPYMKKRRHPAVLRFHKFKKDLNPLDFFFSEALLYKPFSNESILDNEIKDLNNLERNAHDSKIRCVKSQVMEFLEDVSEARYFAEAHQRNEDTGEVIDPQGEQEVDDCEYEGIIDHPDFPDLDLEALEEEVKKKSKEKTYRPIDLDDIEVLMEKTRKLDYYQRKVTEVGIRYARNIVKAIKSKNPMPTAPKFMVHGGAGSGKSTVIKILKQWVHLILQSSGDNPDCPYIFVTAPTGTAAANVRGQTMHSAFGFSFGNEHFSLSDKKRDEKRSLLKNLKCVVIDEISMVKSDQLYQLDMRLREVTQKPDTIFGGVAVFAFGDLLQLQPIQARYIFQEPRCKDYMIGFYSGTHWQSFEVIDLVENHRQDGDANYADLLNRVRVGSQTAEDIKQLEARVRPLGHPDLQGSMYISCTNVEVNKFNAIGLNSLPSELVVVEAVNLHSTIKNFKPNINSKGNIGTERNETPFRQNLELKIGAKVMLTYNIDVKDCLTNGARGKIVAFEIRKSGYLEKVIIKFDDPSQGHEKRKLEKNIEDKYPGCTAIERVMFQYSLSRKTKSVSNCARVIQFPLKLCFATTSHKFQGQTVCKPNKIAIDLRTVFKPAMAYVMLSRVQEINQLFIIGSVPVAKLYADPQALVELHRLENISLNNNPNKWEQNKNSCLKILSLNCQSLKPKIKHLKDDPILNKSDVICLSGYVLTQKIYP